MGTDDFHHSRKHARVIRKSSNIQDRAQTWLFFCEGTKTETRYIEDLIEWANSLAKKKLKIKCEGTGRNTVSLIKSVDNFISSIDSIGNAKSIPYAKVFVVFDKDSFSDNNFNNAIHMCENRGYIPIWSNECIELWFLLHFNNYLSDNGREAYFQKLSDILEKDYKKSDEHFKMITSKTNLKRAVTFAKKLHKDCQYQSSYAKKVPCTLMYQVIDEIEDYLQIKRPSRILCKPPKWCKIENMI